MHGVDLFISNASIEKQNCTYLGGHQAKCFVHCRPISYLLPLYLAVQPFTVHHRQFKFVYLKLFPGDWNVMVLHINHSMKPAVA